MWQPPTHGDTDTRSDIVPSKQQKGIYYIEGQTWEVGGVQRVSSSCLHACGIRTSGCTIAWRYDMTGSRPAPAAVVSASGLRKC
jgi:hypothetical protein